MAKLKPWWLAIGLGLVIWFAIWSPLFSSGMPYTHDGENHLARFANYYLALKEGQLPPRWAPNLMNRYGYPVLNYNYPLANLWSVPFTIINVNLQDTFKLITIFTVIMGAVGVWVWLREQNTSKTASWLGIMAYWSAPYVLSAVFFRGSIGEVMVYGLLPWLFWWLGRLSRSPSRLVVIGGGVLIALLLLAHNVTGLIGLGLVVVLGSVEWGRSKQIWKKALSSLAIGLGLSLWFWLPAIAETNQVVLLTAGIQKEFLSHLVSIRQLATSPLTFGFSTADPVDSLSLGMGAVTIFTLWASFIFLIVTHLGHAQKYGSQAEPTSDASNQIQSHHQPFWMVLIYLGLIFVLIFFQSTLSANLWSLLPFAQIIQFPWRLMLFVPILILPVLAWVWDQGWWTTRVLILVGLGLQIWIALNLSVVDRFQKTNQDYFAFAQSSSTQNENRPLHFTYENIGDWQPTPTVLEGDAMIEVIRWSGSSRQYRVIVNTSSVIVEPTANFIGWQSHATDLMTNQTSRSQYLEGNNIAGRIAYQLEPGSYLINTKFTQQTPARYLGNGILLVTIASIMLLLIQHLKNRNRDIASLKQPPSSRSNR